ncbi:MAG: glutamine-hydrolyzing carbamoyl-phosphate synthase small subunit [Sorangiineae bacterium]|nr:glutamine-hydrolyzing carbamoyl-phosphate synthase small subunit [Polyangiaceae bacterium]MEB2323820.1 glutamine-hydrolyzing carbamoyl-phosphate synthase small subunit [Sorangiineae bacterium]
MKRAWLCLADGTKLSGFSWGADGSVTGEVVFTTGMTGYEEVLTDPSYTGQLVTMTAPHIGDTGITREDAESLDGKPRVAGFVVREPSPIASNWRAKLTLTEYLSEHGVVAIGGVDTRRLTRLLRDRGAQNGCIGTEAPDTLVDRARAAPSLEGLDLARRATCPERYRFTASRGAWSVPLDPRDRLRPPSEPRPARPERHVVAMDFGAKLNMLRCLVDAGCRVTVVPATTTADEVLALAPDGIFLSNGPGDPAAVGYAIDAIGALLGKRPMFGICLGHQLLARALGARTSKMKFGHRGLNQPVQDVATRRVEITSQNHGFVVDVASLGGRARSTHLHLNDGTSEGLEVPDARAFSVQYHPEAAAGPHDTLSLFERFRKMMDD